MRAYTLLETSKYTMLMAIGDSMIILNFRRKLVLSDLQLKTLEGEPNE